MRPVDKANRCAALLVLLLTGTALAAPAPAKNAARVSWHGYDPAAFRRALAEDRLILLVLDAPWSPFGRDRQAELFGQADVAAAIDEGYVLVRERADLRPELARRFPGPRWPAMTILLPTGDPLYYAPEGKPPGRLLFSAVPAGKLAALLREARAYYTQATKRAVELSRKQAVEMAQGALPKQDTVADPLVWAIRDELRGTFDREHRYFGGPPRLPETDEVQFMLAVSSQVEQPYREMATATLDTLLEHLLDASGLMDRMALGLDWEQPQKEKLLDRNARLLETLGVAFRVTGRRTYLERGRKLAQALDRRFSTADGAFIEALCEACPGGRSETVLSGANGLAAAAFIRAGAAFGDAGLVERGLRAAEFLLEQRYRQGRGVPRAVVDGRAVPPTLLVLDDLAEVGWAFVSAYEATGEERWLDAARDIARVALTNLRWKGTGALSDTLIDPKAPGPLHVPLFPLRANAEMARVLVRLYYHNGSRLYRDGARAVLGAFGGAWKDVPRDLPAYGLATYEFTQPAMTAHVVENGPRERADALRRAALGVDYPFVLVHTWHPPIDRQASAGLILTVTPEPNLVFRYGRLQSKPIRDADGVAALAFDLRQLALEQERAIEAKKHPEAAEPQPKRKRR